MSTTVIDVSNLPKQKTMKFLDDLAGGPLTFGDAVRAARDLIGISQAELARRLGVGRQSVCDIEILDKVARRGV